MKLQSLRMQLTLALRYLRGRRLRSFLTTLAVTFGVLVIFGMNILMPSMLAAFQATMLAASNTVDLTVTLRTNGGFSPDALAQVRSTPGIDRAHALLERPVNLPADFFDKDPGKQDVISILNLVGLDPDASQALRNYTMQAGRFLEPGDTAAVVISSALADNLGLQVGDQLAFPTAEGLSNLTVIGIHPYRARPGNEEILVTLPEAQKLLDMPGRISRIEANYANGADKAGREATEAAVKAKLGDTFDYNALSTSSDMFANLQVAQSLFTAFGFLALFMGVFIIFNTFRTVVAERRRDLGMLRAIGASRRMILGLILIEGLIQGVVGTALGLLLGYLLAARGAGRHRPMFEKLLHVRLGAPPVLARDPGGFGDPGRGRYAACGAVPRAQRGPGDSARGAAAVRRRREAAEDARRGRHRRDRLRGPRAGRPVCGQRADGRRWGAAVPVRPRADRPGSHPAGGRCCSARSSHACLPGKARATWRRAT